MASFTVGVLEINIVPGKSASTMGMSILRFDAHLEVGAMSSPSRSQVIGRHLLLGKVLGNGDRVQMVMILVPSVAVDGQVGGTLGDKYLLLIGSRVDEDALKTFFGCR